MYRFLAGILQARPFPLEFRFLTGYLLAGLLLFLGTGAPAAQAEDLVGIVFAHREVDLCAEMEGRIDTVLVEMGDRVAQGSELARLDQGLLLQDLAQARAVLAASRAAAAGAAASAAMARDSYDRHQGSPESWSAEELAQVKMEMELAKADLAGAEAAVEREQAAVGRLEIMIEATVIRAPFDGAVAQRYQGQGAFTGRGTKILRLISDRELWVRFAVPEGNATGLCAGQKIHVSAGPPAIVTKGTIHHVAPEIEASTNMMVVEAALDVPEELQGKILPGMRAGIRLSAGEDD